MNSEINTLKNFLSEKAREGSRLAHIWYVSIVKAEDVNSVLEEIMFRAESFAERDYEEKDDRIVAHIVWDMIYGILNAIIHPQIKKYLDMGPDFYICAIKEYRAVYNSFLKEAKEAVDKIIEVHYPNFRS